jgi:hypothetical protein
MSIVLTDFAKPRLFPREPRRNTIQGITPEAFVEHLNTVPPLLVLDGYAPFCKLHVHRNWTSTRCLVVPITEGNRHRLRSGYEARTKAELPVLNRWFEGVEPPAADHFVVILYDREQMAREGTPIDREAYAKSVAFWERHANWRG